MYREGFVSREELARECGLSPRTLNRRMKDKKIKVPSGYISPDDQIYVLEKIGQPRNK